MTGALYTLAFPHWPHGDLAGIERLRKVHDPVKARRIGGHFTLAFVYDGTSDSYCGHVRQVARVFAPFRFHCRRVMVGTDHASDTGYAFLVPDEGNSGLHTLHDLLHDGALSGYRRLDLPFITHLTLGRAENLSGAKAICDAINALGISVSGVIDRLSVVASRDEGIEVIAEIRLGDGGTA